MILIKIFDDKSNNINHILNISQPTYLIENQILNLILVNNNTGIFHLGKAYDKEIKEKDYTTDFTYI